MSLLLHREVGAKVDFSGFNSQVESFNQSIVAGDRKEYITGYLPLYIIIVWVPIRSIGFSDKVEPREFVSSRINEKSRLDKLISRT